MFLRDVLMSLVRAHVRFCVVGGVFASRTPEQRLRWLDETRTALIEMASASTRARWQRLRRG